MKQEKNKIPLTQIIQNNWFIIKIALKEAPFYAIHLLTSGIMHQVVVFIEHVYMIAYIIDCIQYQKPFWHAALFILIVFVSVRLLQVVGNIYAANFKPKGEEKINRRIRMELYDKAAKIDLSCYDNPEFYTDFVWAMSDVTTRVEAVLKTTATFLGSIVGVLIAGGYILSADPVGIIFVAVAFLLTVIFASKLNKLTFRLEVLLKPHIRKRDYINRVFYLNEYSKEIRMGDLKEKLYEDYSKTNDEIEKIVDKETKKQPWYRFAISYICDGLICNGLYVIYLLYMSIVKKAISYGTMIALFSTVTSLKECMQGFAMVLPEFQKHSMYIDKIRSFLDYDIKIKSDENAKAVPRNAEDIKLTNVSFSYNNGSKEVLKNINLTIKKGEKVAFVGYNGAGKTTLVKLLMRLYDVTSGEVSCGEENIKNFDVESYRKMFGTVFQDYQLFAASLKENVLMDNCDCDKDEITNALNQSGFANCLNQLANGLDTPITREFDENGTNLSGGESQKIAISRVLYKQCPYIILDEPSSALDPIAEYELNNTILNLSHDKTVIFISHRLSTTMMADCIYMFENGEIVEQGNHDTLIELDGKYAEMFKLQAEKYR